MNANIYKRNKFLYEIAKNKVLYLMSAPGVIFLLLFCYVPMGFIIIVFKQYNVHDGIFGSPWIGLKNFQFFFSSASKVWQTTYNTIIINASFIISDLIFQISIAILLNEIRNKYFKKLSQTLLFFPFFLSWVVIGSIIYNMFSNDYGAINSTLKSLGIETINWYMHPEYWRPLLVGAHIWKVTGYGSLVYLATISGFDTTIYEAAIVDGATKFQRIRFITLPLLVPTATILALFSIGRIFFGDFGMVYGIVRDFGPLLETTEVIDTYVFRSLRQYGNFSMSAAVGIYQSFLGLIVIMLSNRLVKKINSGNALF